jgi:deoxycytidylate deaminase
MISFLKFKLLIMFTKRRQEQTESEDKIYKIINKRKQEKAENIDDIKEFKEGSKKHHLFLHKAAEIAKQSNMCQKHGAIVVYKNKIIASGFNYICDYMNNNFSIHAEISAISQLFHNKKLLELCDLYVVRIAPSYDNCLKNSKPCNSCSKFIKKYNIRNVYYSTNYNYDELYIK